VNPNPGLLASILANGYSLTDRLFQNGSTKFLDGQSRPILYGTKEADLLEGYRTLRGESIASHRQLGSFVSNGIVYVVGDGNDEVNAGSGNDLIIGGADDDMASGDGGDDILRLKGSASNNFPG